VTFPALAKTTLNAADGGAAELVSGDIPALNAGAAGGLVSWRMPDVTDPEERGARVIFRTVLGPRWFADLYWNVWLRLKRRREKRVSR